MSSQQNYGSYDSYNSNGPLPRKMKTIKCTCPRNRYSLNCNVRAHREIAMDVQRIFCDFKQSRCKRKQRMSRRVYQSFGDQMNRYSKYLVNLILIFLVVVILAQLGVWVENKAKADVRNEMQAHIEKLNR